MVDLHQPVVVSQDQLPLSCPSLKSVLLTHPRVMLVFEDGKARCPYCQSLYILDKK